MVKISLAPCKCGARSYHLRTEVLFQKWAVELTCRNCNTAGFSIKPTIEEAVIDAKRVAA